ncbi:zona pellucida sperm-binding protein 4 [Austrofundulus limnaeus]|uniref:Zona pellucida sperm-binding protein 4 n=1 Tax=Austrofundulus limnaeus TaxID=52670 RepID=A0A2I4BKX5_AUSLI|nr:PREDICTED: zona pellucida sperm-binding protein 4-like [Austrofundulus limnaeus]
MTYYCVKLTLTWLTVSLMTERCCGSSAHQLRGKAPEQKTHLALPTVSCSARGIRAVFGPLVKNNLHVTDTSGHKIPVLKSKKACGMRVSREKNQNVLFFGKYDGCYTRVEGSRVVIPLLVQLTTGEDRWFRVNISCPLIKRSNQKSKPTPFPGDCDADKSLRIECGHHSISSDTCNKLGCCYDPHASTCYYRLNACSLDGHFVFTVKATDTHPPIDPRSLLIKDQPDCFPAASTSDTAVFKIGVMDCGAKMKTDGDLVTYEVEVEEQSTETKNRHSPFSLQVQCEYEESDLKLAKSLRSLYTVTNPPSVVAQGTMKVQMRIATDDSFSSFIPEDKLPLILPLRETVNVEVSIAEPSPDPSLSLRVRDCFAYPMSKHSVWTLLHDGCPNPQDNMKSSVPMSSQGNTTTHSQFRRFDVKTFAFLDPETGDPSMEEMYFYCWVEICMNDIDCAQSCTIISTEDERQRREVLPSASHHLQLVSLGPLRLVQNKTELADRSSEEQKTMFQVMLYVFSGVGAVLMFVLLLLLPSGIRRCRRTEEQQVSDAQVQSEVAN